MHYRNESWCARTDHFKTPKIKMGAGSGNFIPKRETEAKLCLWPAACQFNRTAAVWAIVAYTCLPEPSTPVVAVTFTVSNTISVCLASQRSKVKTWRKRRLQCNAGRRQTKPNMCVEKNQLSCPSRSLTLKRAANAVYNISSSGPVSYNNSY